MEMPLFNKGYLAGADLSAKEGYAVKLNSAGAVILAGAGEASIGILYRGDTSGRMVTVMHLGIATAILGAGVNNAGTLLTPDAAGKLVTAGGSDNVIAMSINASGASGDKVSVLLVGKATVGTGLATDYVKVCIPLTLTGADNADILTEYTPGFAGEIVNLESIVTTPATTAAKTATLTMEIGTTAVTGGELALTSANCTPLGKVVACSAITDTNSFAADDTISILAANTETPFIEGVVSIILTLKQA